MPKVLHYNTFWFLRYAHPRYVKCFFTNIHKQWNKLKIRLIFTKNTNFTGKQLESFQDLECEIFRVLFSHEHDHTGRFSNLHECTFNVYFNDVQINRWLHLSRSPCSETGQTRKISFYSNKQMNCTSCPKVCKIFFYSKFPVYPEQWWRKKEENR